MNTPLEPIGLVRSAVEAPPAPWPVTEWWILAPVVLLGLAVLLTIQIRWIRARRLSDSERAFRRLASMQRLPTRLRHITRELATAHGKATPAAILLSDHAAREAARRLESKNPPATTRRVLADLLARRGLG